MIEPAGKTSTATIDNIIAQMSRGGSVLNKWDVVLNMEEDVVNRIFQAQFQLAAPKEWERISIGFCQLFPNPGGKGKFAAYTRSVIKLSKPLLTFLGDNQSFVQVSYKANGSTGTASRIVDDTFDPKQDCNLNDPSLDWDDTPVRDTDFTGTVPLSIIKGITQNGEGQTDFVLDFPAGSFTSPLFKQVKDPDEFQKQLKQYLETHKVQYVINSIRTGLAGEIPQMAPKSFRISVLTTNEKKNIFQIFIATENPAQENLTIGINEPVPDGYGLSVMFNKALNTQLNNTLLVQAWVFLQSNLIFPGYANLSLGPEFTPDDALVLGVLEIDPSVPIDSPPNINKKKIMLNIQKTAQISPAGQSAFTVYGDDSNANAWYLLPKVTWVKDANTNLPQFSLIKYNSNGGKVSGFCRFSVQLSIDPAQQKAVSDKFSDAVFPQFDWLNNSAVVFTYTIDGKSTSIQGQPSNYGNQMVTFSLPLDDEKAMAAFVNAFSPNGSGGGTFGVSYELSANTRLPAVTVVSKFDSTIAYQYQVQNKFVTETKYHTDTWGHKKAENVQVYVGSFVKEMMTSSQAGSINVTPGAGITTELLDQVKAWAQTQLQKDVEQSINTALALIKNPTNDFSMQSVSSFTNTLQTTNVVPWYFTVEGTLLPFDSATWAKIYSEVNQQELQTTFIVQEDLAKLGIARVNLSFQYGSNPPETHTFLPGNQAPWSINKPGIFDGTTFVSKFKYQYDVEYLPTQRDGNTAPRLSTEWITSDSTTVKFGVVELGLMVVIFDATNIEWMSNAGDNGVKEITVDWNWLTGDGGPVLNETLVLTQAKSSAKSALRSLKPTSNQVYQFSLTFLMQDGTKLHANGLSGTTPLQRIDHPLSDVSVSVLPLLPETAKAVILRATFDDQMNNIHLSKQWQALPKNVNGKKTLDTSSFNSWDFQAIVANLNTTTIVFSGTWVDEKNKQNVIPKTLVIGTNNTLIISDTQKTVTAVLDASNVSFVQPKTDGVYRVSALVAFSLDGDAPETDPLSSATTISFDRNNPPVQYFPTDPIDMNKTPVFHFQYTYTEVTDNGTGTKVTDNWKDPQSTVSTNLPVMPGKPATTPPAPVAELAMRGLESKGAVSLDRRTKGLFARHDKFCNAQDDAEFLSTIK